MPTPPVEPVPAASATGKAPSRADVVVIGGGIVGAATAWHLARRGVSVVLCEKGRIGAEQSARNWGYCRQQGRDPREVPLIKESLQQWRDMARDTGRDVGFRPVGVAHLVASDAEMGPIDRWMDQARQHGIDTRRLSAKEAADLTPGATTAWAGGMMTPSDGRAEPTLAAPALAAAAADLGAQVLVDCAVRAVETTAGRVSGVVTERGPIATGAVVCAGGAWSRLFLGNLGLDLPQLRVLASVARTGPGAAITETAVKTPGFAMRRHLDGGYSVARAATVVHDIVPDSFRLFSGFVGKIRSDTETVSLRLGRAFFDELRQPRRWAADAVTAFERCRILDPAPHGPTLDRAMASLRACFPALAGVAEVNRWGGMIDATPDTVPVIGPVEAVPGLLVATGFSGHGFGLGPGAGRLAADLVTGDRPVVDPSPFRFDRF